MAETKADLIKKAKELGLEHVTTKNTMEELRNMIAEAAPVKHDKEQLPVEEHQAEVAKAGKRSAKGIKEAEEKVAKQERKAQGSEAKTDDVKPKASQKPPRSRLERRGKKFREAAKLIEADKVYSLNEGLELAIKTSPVKFDASVELHMNLNVDPKQADQNIRGSVVMPAGTGKDVKIAVIADNVEADKLTKAGAVLVGEEKIFAALDKGQFDFDVLIATPATMPKLGKYARVLGPKGLMPNPKSGTVTNDPVKAITEAKAGKVEYRVDSTGIIHLSIGKVSFGAAKLKENADAVISAIRAAKPSSLKGGVFVKAIHLATTMGPSVKISASE